MAEIQIEEIKALLSKTGKVYVNELSEKFNVSKVSVRKYLAKLENQGFATRFYGGASLAQSARTDDPVESLYKDPLLKALALKAREQIADGDSIFVGSGRTCCILARELAGIQNLTVVTNNITALPDLIKNTSRVFLIGGEVTSTDSKTLFSSWESPKLMLENIYVNKAFTSTSGLDLKAGLTVDSIISTYIFKHIPTMAQRWYLIADYNKFDKISIYSVADLNKIDTLICDTFPSQYIDSFKENNINILTVK
ncbi:MULTISPECIES: DeoR/GlpR family DNA-binding transcription regulator [unclassified Oceanispirochaeta]|uniref:DeoR/GlpR family DNA-binding transcription regulator n=1 Tax=unclassified Oceanispirochaeta TaxID=2635722 RepID=UPI000E09166C|nr:MULTISPECIES: DeoR/GlpR family DNA-binding transcription regulator [unclassified Oceanispirochaeta]MBF9016959.1 DeoR/GlpR transcriptional regulator [Oceanispirochaeta sp. M2]NPD73322.1 DeoR/GlpR transcriptional regulator [Oceanispirochaeta sp. M1]RDG30983.1 DeoR/GlpR transcriptional regulator [Oceanispirochaeta sp. M1]